MVEIDKLKIRFAEKSDAKYLIKWLSDPEILKWFPMCNKFEIEDSVRVWMSFMSYKAVLTSVYDGKVCGNALLYLNSLKKISHTALFAIIVDKEYRGLGIGSSFLKELFKLAKERFKLEMLHLEVYVGNPAIRLYERLGFEKYGVHKKFLKDLNGKYYDKVLMQKSL
ncbi:MAG: putative ribosomal N-acetyltransferase YdaF [Candidatus Anoxychlamydiales bacterium]|nr:putative ribosomal N-acetyltransferase YdaF [Candidatus Anoxychlamydiales bacterium]